MTSNERGLEPRLQIQDAMQNKKTPKIERLLICYSKMVHQCDLSWNTFEPSLVLMYEKLVDLCQATFSPNTKSRPFSPAA